MRETLQALAAGDCSVDEAEARLAGYVTGDGGRFDAAREQRRGVPEAIYAPGKTSEEVADLATTAVDSTGRALVTRADDPTVTAVRERVADANPDADVDHDGRARTVVVHADDFEPPERRGTVAVVTGGTADRAVAGEAAVVAAEMGARVDRVEDVGVASLARLVDQLERVRSADVVVAAAGREGALPTVLAGLVDVPVIGVPVSSGYGHGGDGAAALAGLLQSCTVLSVVNVDAGFVAGAQAGLVLVTASD